MVGDEEVIRVLFSASSRPPEKGLWETPQPSSSHILGKPDMNSLMDWLRRPHITLAGLPTRVVNDKGRYHS
jgi:hypothetical protein